MQPFFKLLALAVTFFLAACGGSQKFQQSHYTIQVNDFQTSSFLSENQRTLPPFGYVDFCMREPAECPEWRTTKQYMSDFSSTAATNTPAYGASSMINHSDNRPSYAPAVKRSHLSKNEILRQLHKVNRIVNIAVKPVTDAEGFGVTENWRIPDISGFYGDIGDCEDYALLKRKILAQNGYHYNDLSMAVVKQTNGNIHAVLVVRTDYGDYVLDNLDKRVKPWHATNYGWIKKQSISNPALWVAVSA